MPLKSWTSWPSGGKVETSIYLESLGNGVRRAEPMGFHVPLSSVIHIRSVSYVFEDWVQTAEPRVIGFALSRNPDHQRNPPIFEDMLIGGEVFTGVAMWVARMSTQVGFHSSWLQRTIPSSAVWIPPVVFCCDNRTGRTNNVRCTVQYDLVPMSVGDRAALVWRSTMRPEKAHGGV